MEFISMTLLGALIFFLYVYIYVINLGGGPEPGPVHFLFNFYERAWLQSDAGDITTI